MNARHRTVSEARGFTLIELVVVLLILGLTLAAVAPAFAARRDQSLDRAVDAIAMLLRTARNTALETAVPTAVTFDPASARVWVRADAIKNPLDTSFTIAVPAGTEYSAASPRVRFIFDPRGGAKVDTLMVSSARGRWAVTVDSWTGDVIVTSVAVGADNRAP